MFPNFQDRSQNVPKKPPKSSPKRPQFVPMLYVSFQKVHLLASVFNGLRTRILSHFQQFWAVDIDLEQEFHWVWSRLYQKTSNWNSCWWMLGHSIKNILKLNQSNPFKMNQKPLQTYMACLFWAMWLGSVYYTIHVTSNFLNVVHFDQRRKRSDITWLLL